MWANTAAFICLAINQTPVEVHYEERILESVVCSVQNSGIGL